MIRPININLNAAHPELPLVEATTFTGAPSSVFIRGVPKSVGNWSITAVNVAVTYPDNSTTTRAAVESAEGVWVATVPGTATSGRTVAGFRITADGIDENGAAVTGYLLGFADFSVFSFLPVPAPGETFYLLRYFDTMPTTPKKGDATVVGGVLKYYNGATWLPFADLTNYYTKSDVDPLLFAQYYPDGSVKSAAEFTAGIKYDDPDTVNRTITVKTFCFTGDSANDNSDLSGRVVIPPFVDMLGNGYISDDGTRFKVVGVSGGSSVDYSTSLTDIIAPNTVTTVGNKAFSKCTSLTSVSIPAAQTIGEEAFAECFALTSVSIPAAQTIGEEAFTYCISLTSVSLPAATNIGFSAFKSCGSLASVDFGDTPRSSVPSLGVSAFSNVPTSCKIIVPYMQYDAWKAASGWSSLPQEFVRHAEKADKPATFTTGNLAALDANGNPTDSTIPAANVALKGDIPYTLGSPTVIDTASSETVEGETVYYGAATLANRTANVVQVTAATALDELRITFPAATSGKVRDFGLRVEIGTGSAALAAPALVPIAPTGETIKIENADGAIPALADGTATAKGVTLLYFSETAPGVFVVKGENVEEVA